MGYLRQVQCQLLETRLHAFRDGRLDKLLHTAQLGDQPTHSALHKLFHVSFLRRFLGRSLVLVVIDAFETDRFIIIE
jgi:hypothetical protein